MAENPRVDRGTAGKTVLQRAAPGSTGKVVKKGVSGIQLHFGANIIVYHKIRINHIYSFRPPLAILGDFGAKMTPQNEPLPGVLSQF